MLMAKDGLCERGVGGWDRTADHSWLGLVRTDSASRATRASGAAAAVDASETKKRNAIF